MKQDFKEWEKVKKEHDHLFKPHEERQAQLKAKQKEIKKKSRRKIFCVDVYECFAGRWNAPFFWSRLFY